MIAQKLRKLVIYSSIAFLLFTLVLAILLMANLKSAFNLQLEEFSKNVSKDLEFQFSQKSRELQRVLDTHKSLLDRLSPADEELALYKESLISNFKMLDIDFLAFYESDGLIHTLFLDDQNVSRINNLLDKLSFKQLTGKTYFFLDSPETLFPIQVFVLYPSPRILNLWQIEEPSVITVGNYWTVTDLVKLEELTGASISYSDKPGISSITKLVYSYKLLDHTGKGVAYLIFSKNFTLLTRYLLYVVILVITSIAILISILSVFYVKLKHLALEPFSDIIYAIDNHTPDTVEKYIYRDDEIGSLANTIKKYLHQREQINLYLKELESKNQSLRSLNEQIRQLLEKDVLTGLLTRYVFNSQIERLYVSSKADRIPLSAISIDADDFKRINDTFGHNVGDEVLKGIAEVILKNVRASDFPIRMGGEEILILLPEADIDAAHLIAERIRTKVEEKFKDTPYKVTISLGVTQLKGSDTIESFLKRADEALYISKSNGKNRTTTLF
ncbi:diguanylate cyclase (GGDEF) domain-containing protein [Fervidobacterium changbaicum]|uniref:GGDEF domain-containing protein n=1 Tax=Fervidobacterium changbaicum TaxID=310769 RepID=A0ABX5QU48_9BACT|nr:diguanylate cyclase [Fervidobacterium changbaicum]QAV33911.1 GGDEF domain-containing protein [Fervidobacterium changbaicum]SDH55606.1 diguanylate cyclase (GGDEF) domain-containing protein [Fervidobacterium changbaicum]